MHGKLSKMLIKSSSRILNPQICRHKTDLGRSLEQFLKVKQIELNL